MKKKKGFKSWLAGLLRKWANMLEPEKKDVFKVEHVNVPVVTLSTQVTVPRECTIDANEFLAKGLSDEVAKYMYVEKCEMHDFNVDRYDVYRATIRVVDERY